MPMYSMYEVMLKQGNIWQGRIAAKLWKGLNEQQREEQRSIGKNYYIPEDYLSEKWHVDLEANNFANFKASEKMTPYTEFCGDALLFGERLFTASWWVWSIVATGVLWEYKGFERKQDAYLYYKERKESHDYFDICMFKLMPSDITDFVPHEYLYPVQEIAEKKWKNAVRNRKPRQNFLLWFCQYLHNTIYHEYRRCGEDDVDFWWGLYCDFQEVEKQIKEEHKNLVFHLYELMDITYREMFDGGMLDLSYFK